MNMNIRYNMHYRCCSALQCVAVQCAAAQCVAVQCVAVQCVAVCCNMQLCVIIHIATHTLLQCVISGTICITGVAVRCSAL